MLSPLRTYLVVLVSVITAGTIAPRGAYAQQYTLTSMGTLGGTQSEGWAINNNGQVTGWANTAGEAQDAFIYSNGIMTNLGTLGGPISIGMGINDSGQVSGSAQLADDSWHAFVYSNGTMSDLGTLLVGGDSYAYGINAGGQIVGNSETEGAGHAFLYSNGHMSDLGALGGIFSTAFGINASGAVTGQSDTANNVDAFVYANGTMTDLGSLVSGGGSSGQAINASGQITGYAGVANGSSHAFLYSNGKMLDLGALYGRDSEGLAINTRGEVVGSTYQPFNPSAFNPNGTTAFIYNGKMLDLNTLDTGSPLAMYVTLTSATAINDNGWIVADGVDSRTDLTTVYLLQPVPLPATGWLMLSGLGGLGFAIRRRRSFLEHRCLPERYFDWRATE